MGAMWILAVILSCLDTGSSRETCEVSGSSLLYCEDGYECCHGKTDCCSNFLSVGAVVGIIIGCLAVIAVVVILAVLIQKCQSNRGPAIQPLQGPVVSTTTTAGNVVPTRHPPPTHHQHEAIGLQTFYSPPPPYRASHQR